MPIQSHSIDLLEELQILVRQGPGLRKDLLAQAVASIAKYCDPPFIPFVRINAQQLTRYFGSWFSENNWNNQHDGGRRLRNCLLEAIQRLCSAVS